MKVLEKKPLGINIIILVEAIFVILQLNAVVTTPLDTILYLRLFDLVIIVLSIVALVGLWLMRKWGAVLIVVVLSIGIIRNMNIFRAVFIYLISFEGSEQIESIMFLNSIFVLIMLVYEMIALIYMFNKIFRGMFH